MSNKTLRRFGSGRSVDAQLPVIGGTGTRRFSVCRRARSHAEWFRRPTTELERYTGLPVPIPGSGLIRRSGSNLTGCLRSTAWGTGCLFGVFDVFVDQYRMDVMAWWCAGGTEQVASITLIGRFPSCVDDTVRAGDCAPGQSRSPRPAG